MKTKRIILISIVGFLVLIILIMLGTLQMGFQNQLSKSLNVDKLCVSCSSKYYSNEKSDNDLILSSNVMYYEKKVDGNYNIKCGDFSIYDNVLYHNTIGPYLSSGSRTELTEQEVLNEYKGYFLNATKWIAENEYDAPLYNYIAVTNALKEHKTLLIKKNKKGNEIKYKLYFGKGFYEDIIKYVEGGKLIWFDKPMKFPVVVKFENGKLSEISIKFAAMIEFKALFAKYTGTSFYEFVLHYDYEKDFFVTDEQKEMPYSFYQDYVPKDVFQSSAKIHTNVIKFYNGKVYLIPDEYNNNRRTLDIYDLKTGTLIKRVDLPLYAYNTYNIVIHGDNIYVPVDPNDEEKVFCYNEKTEQSILYDVPALSIFFVDDELVVIENGKRISCGKDWDSLVQTNKYNDATIFYYDHYSGSTYALTEIDGKKYLVKLTKNGFSNNKIQLPETVYNYETTTKTVYDFEFTQEGIIIRKKSLDLNSPFDSIHSEYFLYNNDLEEVKEWEVDIYDGEYLGETDEYVFYTSFVINKKTGKFYGFEVGVYKNFAIFDGILYFHNNDSIFSTETLLIKNNY